MLRLLMKLFIFFLPLLILSLLLAGLAWHAGEAMPAVRVVELQHNNAPGVIYGQEQSCDLMEYKLAAYRSRQPEILILGSSLMMFIRAAFFTENPGAVYNAAVNGWDFEDMLVYNAHLGHNPKIIIALVKPQWFIADAVTESAELPASPSKSCGYEDVLLAMTRTAHYLVGGDLTLRQLIDRRDLVFGGPSLGLRAIEQGAGYRADGSFILGRGTASVELQEQGRTKALNNQPIKINAPKATFSEPALNKLDAFLAGLHQEGVTVVGVSTPVHFEIYEQMLELGAYSNLDEAARRIAAIFSAYGFSYHFINDLRSYGMKDNEWFDAAHLTESGSLRLMLTLFQQHPDLFERYTDINKVDSLLANYTNPMDVLRELDP